MNNELLIAAAQLSDQNLLARLKDLSIRERGATVELLAHLAELDGRRSHLGEGPGSVYAYCRDVLGYSDDAAWNRAATANVVRRHPFVLEWLSDGTLNITTVRMVRRILTAANHLEVLTAARRRSKGEVELIVRRYDPKPDVASTIRKVAAPDSASTALTLSLPEPGKPAVEAVAPPAPASAKPGPRPPRGCREKKDGRHAEAAPGTDRDGRLPAHTGARAPSGLEA